MSSVAAALTVGVMSPSRPAGSGAVRFAFVASGVLFVCGLVISTLSYILIRRYALLHGVRGLMADLWPLQIVPFAVAGSLMLMLAALGYTGLRTVGWVAIALSMPSTAWLAGAAAGGWPEGLPAASMSLCGIAALVAAAKSMITAVAWRAERADATNGLPNARRAAR